MHSTFNTADNSGGAPAENAVVYDLVGPAFHDGTVVGMAVALGAGILGDAIDFLGLLTGETGTNRALNYGNVFNVGNGELTVSFWLKVDTSSSHDQILISRGGNGTSGATNSGWSIAVRNNDAFRIILNNERGTGNRQITTASGYVQSNTWYHGALTVKKDEDGTGLVTAYINGISNAFTSNSPSGFVLPEGDNIVAPNNRPVYVGRRGPNTTPTNGLIDDLGIWTHALSAEEVLPISNNGLSGIPLPDVTSGDFDRDGDIDGADFLAWQTNVPLTSEALSAEGDAGRDGDVDGADFAVWQLPSAVLLNAAATPVPEPTSFGVALITCVSLLRSRLGLLKVVGSKGHCAGTVSPHYVDKSHAIN